jgi:hypothetical protein
MTVKRKTGQELAEMAAQNELKDPSSGLKVDG